MGVKLMSSFYKVLQATEVERDVIKNNNRNYEVCL